MENIESIDERRTPFYRIRHNTTNKKKNLGLSIDGFRNQSADISGKNDFFSSK